MQRCWQAFWIRGSTQRPIQMLRLPPRNLQTTPKNWFWVIFRINSPLIICRGIYSAHWLNDTTNLPFLTQLNLFWLSKMASSSRQQCSRWAYADSSSSSHATYNDYEHYSRPQPQHSEHHVDEAHSALLSHGSYRSRALHDCHGGYDFQVSSGNREPGRTTVTRYHINTSSVSPTSYHDRREHTVYDGHRSSSRCRETRHAHSYSWADCSSSSCVADGEDERSSSDEGHRDPTWRPRDEFHMSEASSQRSRAEYTYSDRHYSNNNDTIPGERKLRGPQSLAEEPRRYLSYAHAKHSRPNEPMPPYTEGHASKRTSYSNHRDLTNDDPSQGKLESGSSRCQEKYQSRRSQGRRGEDPRSNRNDPFHEDREQRYHQEVSQPKAKETDHYATLKLGPFATDEEIKSAAKRRRVEVRPDKLKNSGMSDSECAKIDAAAADVGQATDIPQTPEQKLKYNRKLYAAKSWKWHGKWVSLILNLAWGMCYPQSAFLSRDSMRFYEW